MNEINYYVFFLHFTFNTAAILRDFPRMVVELGLLGGSQNSFCIKHYEFNIQQHEITQHLARK